MSEQSTPPLTAAPDPAPAPAAAAGKRTRAPHYDVFELRRLRAADDDGLPIADSGVVMAWVPIASDVAAENDRAAIREAVADRPEAERYGTFWAPLAGALRPRTRRQQVITDDIWE